MQGWFRVYRDLFEKPIWLDSTPEQKTILITLISMANHQEKQWEWKGEMFQVKPGQFITSLDSIVKKAGIGISVRNVRTALKRFENYGFLTNQSTNKNRLITLLNWGFYQGNDDEVTSKVTGNRQASDKQVTTNKNVKNEKMKRNKDNIRLEIDNFRLRYSENQLKIIDDYLEMIRHTRVSAKLSDSVILKMYKDWDKHPQICVEYGLKTHVENPAYHSKKENYTMGIIRNTPADEAAKKLGGVSEGIKKNNQIDFMKIAESASDE
jgi:hypothetical protein